MQTRPEDKPKLIALSVSIVLVICLFCRLVIPRMLINNAVNAPAQQHIAAASVSAVAPAVPTVEKPNAAAVPTVTSTATPADPFWRPLALAMKSPRIEETRVAKPVTAPVPPVDLGTPLHTKPVSVTVAPIAPPPLPDVEFQGTVRDETAMAVLRVGGQTRFMQEGEMLEGGWSLVRIQTNSVLLRQGSREVVLTLGQSHIQEAQPTSPAPAPVSEGMAGTLPPFRTVALKP